MIELIFFGPYTYIPTVTPEEYSCLLSQNDDHNGSLSRLKSIDLWKRAVGRSAEDIPFLEGMDMNQQVANWITSRSPSESNAMKPEIHLYFGEHCGQDQHFLAHLGEVAREQCNIHVVTGARRLRETFTQSGAWD